MLTDIARADELNTSFGTQVPVETDDDWKARIQVWRDRARVDRCLRRRGSPRPARLVQLLHRVLRHAVRERGLLPLEEAVQLLTDVPAQLYGLNERGRITEGWKADVVVLDPDTVGSHEVRMRMDLPGGAGRLYAEADGIDHVLVNGSAIVRDGVLTDERNGSLLRSGRDTSTASLA